MTRGIATDGTMGPMQTFGGANVVIPQSLGSTAGNNLFHSFTEFNIATGQTVTFTGADTLQNVFSRVTGTDISQIDGLLKSSIAHAAFYFINPNGITFGPNAQVDVPGAFHISTADKIDFPNNAAFYADSRQASTLSSEAPAAFGFLETSASNNGLIDVDSVQSAAYASQTLDVVAGNITVENYANVNTAAGEIRLVATQGTGTVSLQPAADGTLPLPAEQPSAVSGGKVEIDNSSVGASGNGGGRISLWAGNTILNNSSIYVDNEGGKDATVEKGIDIRSYKMKLDNSLVAFDAYYGTGKAGSVSVDSRQLDILSGGAITSNSYSAGDAGTVRVVADTLRIDGQYGYSDTGIASDARSGSSGNAGSVIVSAKNLEVLNGGTISSNTLSSGDAGAIVVEADMLRIDGQGGSRQTGIVSESSKGSSGDAGGVSVSAGILDIFSLGSISSSTWSTGNAGVVQVTADKLMIDGQGNPYAGTGIFSGVYTHEPYSGHAGDVIVQAGTLDIFNGGTISSSTFSGGNAGSVLVGADELNINSRGFLSWDTGIVSNAEAGSSGSGGNLAVQAGKIELSNGGVISSSTFAKGQAGTVQVTADTIKLDGQGGSRQTGIVSESSKDSSGDAGGVSVSAGILDIFSLGSISSSTWSTGNAGVVQVTGDQLRIDGQGNANAAAGIFSGVYTHEPYSGDAGGVIVQAGTLDIFDGGTISSSTFSGGNAGSVLVGADELNINSRGFLPWDTGIVSNAEAGSSGSGGNLAVQAGKIELSNGGVISSSTFAKGQAGTVQVIADTIKLDGQGGSRQTGIVSESSKGSSGDAGGVSVNAGILDIFSIGSISSSTWTTGNAGAVLVTADRLRIDGQGNPYAGTGIFSGVYSSESSSGNGGNVAIAANTIELARQGTISSSTFSTGNAGTLQIRADKIDIADGANISSSTDAQGHAGAVDITTSSLVIDGGDYNRYSGTGILSAANKGSSGNSGGIKLVADNVSITRLGGIFAESEQGKGGKLELAIKRLDLSLGAMISATAFGSGQAGDIVIYGVDELNIDGSADDYSYESGGSMVTGQATGIFLNSQGPGNGGSLNLQANRLRLTDGGVISALATTTGKGGNIDIHSRTVEMTGGALISASTWGPGNAGAVNVEAEEAISISGRFDRNQHSSFTSRRESEQSSITGNSSRAFGSASAGLGASGSVFVSAPLLTLSNGGEINVSTDGPEKAGSVKIDAGTLAISGRDSHISAEANAGSGGQTGDVRINASAAVRLSDNGKISIENAGNSGNPAGIIPGSISIGAPDIDMQNSQISSSSSGNVAAGNITVNFSHWLTMDPSFISTTANTGNGGTIAINGGEAIYLQDSGFRTTVSGAASNGGDIFTTAKVLAMNTGLIQANAVGGYGGNITLSLESLIPSGNTLIKGGRPVLWQPFTAGFNVIQAASEAGVSGSVNVTAPQLNLSGVIANLGGPQFDTNIIGQDYCGASVGSSLTRKGMGGVKPKSGDQLAF
ncbi:MAG: beta strand repeat-containing protein [Methylobacter sp.]